MNLMNNIKFSCTNLCVHTQYKILIQLIFSGDNIQTAVSVARECGILSNEEYIVDVVAVASNEGKDRPEIIFNVQSQSPRLVNLIKILFLTKQLLHAGKRFGV